jgi:5-methyltetrahydropteroyltriglutamate--homocysteine methyltransferase
VDEPALREGLPLKPCRAAPYLSWATAAFRLCCGVASPSVQMVTHLCYSQFEEILDAINDLDGTHNHTSTHRPKKKLENT